MMRQLFLFGGIPDSFESNSAPFVEAAGGRSARIALLLQGGPDWEAYVSRYRDPWLRLGAAEVVPIVPAGDTTELSAEALSHLRDCSGIFMGGGDTRRYREIYVLSEAGAIISERYMAGIPYGGMSAGALVVPEVGIVWGSKMTEPTNQYLVRTEFYLDPEGDGDVELRVGEGLGLLRDCIVEVHCTELGGLPRMIQAVELAEATHGLGMDDPICLAIQDETRVKVHGSGRAYVARRLGSLRFEIQVLEPGDEFEMTPHTTQYAVRT
ncbi:MAG: Type 1 glutamine amidotransferase-like domain-containing protein [Anaerolineae bacterium]